MAHGEGTTQSVRDATYEVGLGLLLQLALVLNHDLTQSLARDGLTMSRARVLWELRNRGPSLQRALAEALAVTARTMTGLIDGLVASGFVTREPHPSDRRAALVTFTPHGAATVGAMERDQRQFVQILFGGMSDQQVECLITGLADLLARLRAHGLQLPQTAEGDSR